MNALPLSHLEDAAERTARHMRQCAELADLAMQLARAAARSALAALAEPETPATLEPPSEPAAEPQSDPMPARARPPRAAGLYLRAPSCKSIDPALLFTRLAAVVRDCVALEARLAAGTAPTHRAEPRRAILREFFRHVTQRLPGGAQHLRDATTRLDEMLAADRAQTTKHHEILSTICEELGIEIHFPTLPDEYLDLLIDPDDDPEDSPDPHATDPPQ